MGRLIQFQGTPILPGQAAGTIIAADAPLSFWGGFDPETGQIIDQRHPLTGRIASGHILVIPSGRGSCSGSGVLLEAIRNGTAPAAIVTSRIDPIIALGAVLGDELYSSHPVIVVVDDATRKAMRPGDWLSIARNGQLTVDQRTHARP
jgi:predicted aconitase with swiveling domain